MREWVMTPGHLSSLPPAPSRSTEGVLFPLIGLGFVEVIPCEFSLFGVARPPSDFVCVLPMSEEENASVRPLSTGSSSVVASRSASQKKGAHCFTRTSADQRCDRGRRDSSSCKRKRCLTSLGLRLTRLGKAWLRSCSYVDTQAQRFHPRSSGSSYVDGCFFLMMSKKSLDSDPTPTVFATTSAADASLAEAYLQNFGCHQQCSVSLADKLSAWSIRSLNHCRPEQAFWVRSVSFSVRMRQMNVHTCPRVQYFSHRRGSSLKKHEVFS